MENGLLDRVEGNVNVHRWSEQTQLEKGDSLDAGYTSELSDYTRISVTQNNLQELKEIWDQWGNETKQLFYGNYGDLPYLLDVQVDEHLFRALVDRIYSRAANGLILTYLDETKKVDIFALSLYGLMVFPRALRYVDEATTDLFHRLSKRVTSVPAILTETFRSLGTCRKAGAGRFIGCAQLLLAWFYSHFRLIDRVICRVFFEDYSPLKDIVASTRRVDVPEENWIALLQNLQSKDVEWRAPWLIPGEILYRQFVPATHGLAQSELAYRGADYKKRVGEISSAWNKTFRLKGVAISPATIPEYVEWKGKRINDNIPEPSVEGARPMEEYLQKMEVEKERKEKRKIEEDKDDLKEHYKKAQVSFRRARVGGSSDQLQKEVQEGKARAEYWEKNHDSTVELKELKSKVEDLEVALHKGKLQIEQLETQEDYLKGELHQSKGQVKERDHVMGEAIAQIREVAEYVQDLANGMREQMMEAQRNMMAEMA
ncbi:hypothetical protein CXB51_013779 [Gossypium anomalum]|uniref:DUF7745 domain-containing protein n=1 Tax=Gossypium anomalum TaxID=47600 RepID=A0A8J5YZF0_9ROSI|nr:hypothetical protein CXB51_013779 [Gossypium anomalum]